MDWLYVPEDVIMRGSMNASEKNALNAFLNYFDGVGTKNFNGYEKAQFTKTAAKVQTGKGSRKDQKTTNLEFDELITTRDKLSHPLQVVFMIAAYSGGRLEQINRLYDKVEEGNDLRIDDFGDFFRVDVRHVSAGGKRASYYYFPAEMKNAVLNYRNVNAPDTISKRVSDAGRDNYREEHGKQVHRPVNVSSLRKFNTLLLRKAGIDKDVTNALQGRAPDGVDEVHYLELADDMGREQYPRVIPLLREGLPVPDWMRSYAGNKPYIPATGKSFDEKKLMKMLKAGATNSEIRKEMGLHPDKITKFVKENGIVRSRGTKAK
ncbi:integrase [Methanorbis furvi]|uniref:integrase n=1 Tax=Methanorbis furvi TaxID=3028299 RepID=UPI0030B8E5C4